MDGWSDPVAADDVLVAHDTRMATGLPDAEPNVLLVGARAAARLPRDDGPDHAARRGGAPAPVSQRR
ncbi:hypothetical protein [Calidifontibacter indicus]|uniref:hypothetical protein n=1 Tax=Calidifontibacter indicus TaxID=419650 RepID=UPI003D737BF0